MRTRDPFLWAHEIRPYIYDISSMLRPVSVRDQLVRGTLLARRAVERGVLHADHRPLLIVGGGAAGVACALEAIHHYIPTTLVEDKDELFFRLRSCNTRQVNPTLYDWPAMHWPYSIYPWHDDEPGELTVTAGPANELVNRWMTELARAKARRPGLLQIRLQHTLEPRPQREQDTYRVRLKAADGATESLSVGMIVFATGPGVEHNDDDKFRSYRFWDNDPLAEAELRADKILISGGGDGSVQDLMRVLFQPGTDLALLVHRLNLPHPFARFAHSLSEHDSAVFQWCRDAFDEHLLGRFVQERFGLLLDEIWHEQGDQIGRIFESVLRPRRPHVVVAHRCDHFTRMYTLNRVLAGLIVRWARATGNNDIEFRANTVVNLPIECEHGLPSVPDPAACFGQKHLVRFERQTCHGTVPTIFSETFDAVLLRHGAKTNVPYETWFRARQRHVRQIVPAHIAHLA